MLKVKPSPIELAIQLTTAVTNTMSEAEFYEFCRTNPDLNIERNAQGETVVMAPAGANSGRRNAVISLELGLWARKDGRGLVFDSSTGFTPPNGAIRSPDVAWVRREKLAKLTAVQKQRFLPLCPDFVIELQSPSDDSDYLAAKLSEYIENGTQLGWLINPQEQSITVYRPNQEPETHPNLAQLSGEPEMPGLIIDLQPIWKPAF